MKKAEVWEASCIGQNCSDLIYYVYVVKLLSNVWENGNYMLIFKSHLPHIIMNSWRPLHNLSHSKIIIEGTALSGELLVKRDRCSF